MLLDTPEINKIESRFISLFDRTFKKGIQNKPGPQLKRSIKQAFSSATFRVQVDKVLDDIYLYTVDYVSSELNEQLSASISSSKKHINLFASDEYLPLTEETVRQSTELSQLVADSIIRTLQDEGIYQENPRVLAKRILDLWGNEKYRAERFARTFSADVATNTALVRYRQNGIEEVQFYARIDNRTTPQCRTMHGTICKSDSKEVSHLSCPLHHNCRSCWIPVTSFTQVDDSLRYENRDFTNALGQNLKPLDSPLDSDFVKNTFKEIDKFKEKWSIPKFILDEDVEKRLMRLGVLVLSG